MSLVIASGLTIAHGANTVLADAGFTIGENDRIGLVGANGSGKSSLLVTLAGRHEADAGTLAMRRGLTIAMAEQEVPPTLLPVPLYEAQDDDDLMWIRNDFLWHSGSHGKLIVHGHTPVEEPTHYGNRINIDCGAGWGNPLVPVVLEGGACFALTEDGRQQVKAPGEYYL